MEVFRMGAYSNDYVNGILAGMMGQGLPGGITATGVPGEINIPGIGKQRLGDMRIDTIWDRVLITPASIPAGTRFPYFRDIQGKQRHETNMVEASRLPKGQEAIVYRINVLPLPNTPFEDVELILSYGYGEFLLDEDTRVKSGPLFLFPSAWGMYGNIMTTNTAATEGLGTNGIPSPGAQPRMMIPIFLSEQRTFRFDIVFYPATVLSGTTHIYVCLDVLMTRPLR